MMDKRPIEVILTAGCLMQHAKEKKAGEILITLPVRLSAFQHINQDLY
jgi:hypothetical protein